MLSHTPDVAGAWEEAVLSWHRMRQPLQAWFYETSLDLISSSEMHFSEDVQIYGNKTPTAVHEFPDSSLLVLPNLSLAADGQ